MGWREKFKALLDDPDIDAEDTPAEPVEPAADDTAALDPDENPEPVGLGEDPSTEPDAGGAEPGDDPDAPEGGATLPEGDENPDSLRDSLNRLAAENESLRGENDMLRSRIASLGGDSALGIAEADPEPVADEPEPYDAEADAADQRAQIEKLKNG